MIKVKAYPSELVCFTQFLTKCIEGQAKTGDTVKEFYLDYSLDQLRLRIAEKLFKVNNDRDRKTFSTVSVKVLRPELVALSIYFQRHEVEPFLKVIEQQIIKQVPAELIKVLKPNQLIQ